MRIARLSLLGFLLCSVFWGQAQEVHNPSFRIRKFRIREAVKDAQTGSLGLQIEFEYRYRKHRKDTLEPPETLRQKVRLMWGEGLVYEDSVLFGDLQLGRRWHEVAMHIPYRLLELQAGMQEELTLSYQLVELLTYEAPLSFEQPKRFLVNFVLESAAVKQSLWSWDTGGPYTAPPDPYWQFRLKGAQAPIYRSGTTRNNYALRPDSISFFLVDGELAQIEFYEEDEGTDTLLGILPLEDANFDMSRKYYGRMFDDLKLVTYRLDRQTIALYPVSLKIQENYIHQGREGLYIRGIYDLSSAYKGEVGYINLVLRNKQGDTLAQPFAYGLGVTSDIDKYIALQARDTMEYFLPYYVWPDSVYTLSMEIIEDYNRRALTRTPFLVRIPGKNYLKSHALTVTDSSYLGASGTRATLALELEELHEYAVFEFRLYDKQGRAFTSPIYGISGMQTGTPFIDGRIALKNMEAKNEISFFIPDYTLGDDYAELEVVALPDANYPRAELPLLRLPVGALEVPDSLQDVKLVQTVQDTRLHKGSFGHYVEFEIHTPEFYLDSVRWVYTLTTGDTAYTAYLEHHPTMLGADGTHISTTEGTVSFLVPFRHLHANQQLTLYCQAVDDRDFPLSQAHRIQLNTPQDLEAKLEEVTLAPRRIRLHKAARKEEAQLYYEWRVGDERVLRTTLPKKVKKADFPALTTRLKMHTRDRLSLYAGKGRMQTMWTGNYFRLAKAEGRLKEKPLGVIRKIILDVHTTPKTTEQE